MATDISQAGSAYNPLPPFPAQSQTASLPPFPPQSAQGSLPTFPPPSAHIPYPAVPPQEPKPVPPLGGPLPLPLSAGGRSGGRRGRGGGATRRWLSRTCLWMLFFFFALPLLFRGVRHILHAVANDPWKEYQSDLFFHAVGAAKRGGSYTGDGNHTGRGFPAAVPRAPLAASMTPANTAAANATPGRRRLSGVLARGETETANETDQTGKHGPDWVIYDWDNYYPLPERYRKANIIAGSAMVAFSLALSALLFWLLARRFARRRGGGANAQQDLEY